LGRGLEAKGRDYKKTVDDFCRAVRRKSKQKLIVHVWNRIYDDPGRSYRGYEAIAE
jgi:hypothetical protein